MLRRIETIIKQGRIINPIVQTFFNIQNLQKWIINHPSFLLKKSNKQRETLYIFDKIDKIASVFFFATWQSDRVIMWIKQAWKLYYILYLLYMFYYLNSSPGVPGLHF